MPAKSVLTLSTPPLLDKLDRRFVRAHRSQNSSDTSKQDFKRALREFEEQNPEYGADAELSTLRSTEFSRLKTSETVYVDYMGGSLYPESLVSRHLEVLKMGVFGNTHSDSPTYATSCLRCSTPHTDSAMVDYPGQHSPSPTSKPPVQRCSTFLMHPHMNTSVSSLTMRLGRSSSWVKHSHSPIDRPMSCQPTVTIVSMAFGDSRIRLVRRYNIWTPYVMAVSMRQG